MHTEAATSARISLEAVGLSLGGREVLRAFSLEVPEGSVTVLLGPSGCGKTTALRLVDGLIAPDTGRVLVGGLPARPGPQTGFVFQSYRLIPWATVAGNVEFGLRATGLSPSERQERTARYLRLVGLGRVAGAYPRALSGGMRQRVALARALAPEPRLLLMDEPFASIDAQSRELMQMELMRIWDERRPTVLFVTHSVDEALQLADRIALIGPAPGHVAEVIEIGLERPRWDPALWSTPRYRDLRRRLTERMRQFVFSDPNSEFYGRDREFRS